ncbi:MAG: 1-(5-phosphoribosyl)-5-[(5-phosphoribosylamino)methylideneamino] imidazole-4-carboxamide isomerase [Spirochaetales bacterium]|nr:1-(5-phosphoribosyl)-5-[(5-phosphoribosylamino)methylideneamino] imidazole-4-carboxamide isomerase [Spirochaetales bacterium]
MIVIPAIDLLDGRCVRLTQGDYNRSQVYSGDPAGTARQFVLWGAERLHLVDLGAARRGGLNNRQALGKIREAVKSLNPGVVIEAGGGIRTEGDVEELLGLGIDRLIIGTLLVKEPQTVESWIARYGRVFIAGIDARNGLVRVAGWEEASAIQDEDLARQAADMGFESLIYTNIERDGALTGPDIEATLRIARAAALPVILSGGVGSPEDIRRIARASAAGEGKIWGAITGKALYEGRLDLAEAIRLSREL